MSEGALTPWLITAILILFADYIAVALFRQLFAKRGCTAALPNNRVIDWLSGVFIPKDNGFALVRNTDCGNLVHFYLVVHNDSLHHAELAFEKFLGIVLNPARLRVVLRELLRF